MGDPSAITSCFDRQYASLKCLLLMPAVEVVLMEVSLLIVGRGGCMVAAVGLVCGGSGGGW